MKCSKFLPSVEQPYRGARISFYFLILVAIAGTVRSLIHILAPDGGAYSIAGIDVAGPNGANIIAMFAQWGASQLVLALIYWLVILKYRFLIPAMLIIVFLEQVLRIFAGQLKPITVAAAPPGEIGSYLLLPLALIAFMFSLREYPKVQQG
jgi:hypothetical protein